MERLYSDLIFEMEWLFVHRVFGQFMDFPKPALITIFLTMSLGTGAYGSSSDKCTTLWGGLRPAGKYAGEITYSGFRVISEPAEYLRLIENKETQATELKISGLKGRILRGVSEKDFESLSPNSDRKLVMFMGEDGLQSLLGKSGPEMLKVIGYPESDILKMASDGTIFRLFVFKSQEQVAPATWENLPGLAQSAYPDSDLGNIIRQHLPSLIKHSGPEGYNAIMKEAPSQIARESKMTLQQLTENKLELWAVRKFLHDVLNLNELYMGDGYTYFYSNPSEGEPAALTRGLKEYFGLNVPTKSFGNSGILELKDLR